MEFKANTTESTRLLVFKFSKNDKIDKKRDDIAEMMLGDYALPKIREENDFRDFK